jgi:hypothetical protein
MKSAVRLELLDIVCSIKDGNPSRGFGTMFASSENALRGF